MTPNLSVFLDACDDVGLDRSLWQYTGDPNHRLTLKAPSENLSPVLVHDFDDEFVVDTGTKHHTHFRGPRYPNTTDIDGAAADAAVFIRALLSDQVCVTVDYLDGRCVGSSHFFLVAENLTPASIRESRAGIQGGNIHTERFLWSGAV